MSAEVCSEFVHGPHLRVSTDDGRDGQPVGARTAARALAWLRGRVGPRSGRPLTRPGGRGRPPWPPERHGVCAPAAGALLEAPTWWAGTVPRSTPPSPRPAALAPRRCPPQTGCAPSFPGGGGRAMGVGPRGPRGAPRGAPPRAKGGGAPGGARQFRRPLLLGPGGGRQRPEDAVPIVGERQGDGPAVPRAARAT